MYLFILHVLLILENKSEDGGKELFSSAWVWSERLLWRIFGAYRTFGIFHIQKEVRWLGICRCVWNEIFRVEMGQSSMVITCLCPVLWYFCIKVLPVWDNLLLWHQTPSGKEVYRSVVIPCGILSCASSPPLRIVWCPIWWQSFFGWDYLHQFSIYSSQLQFFFSETSSRSATVSPFSGCSSSILDIFFTSSPFFPYFHTEHFFLFSLPFLPLIFVTCVAVKIFKECPSFPYFPASKRRLWND